jgi:hypothetical protein
MRDVAVDLPIVPCSKIAFAASATFARARIRRSTSSR